MALAIAASTSSPSRSLRRTENDVCHPSSERCGPEGAVMTTALILAVWVTVLGALSWIALGLSTTLRAITGALLGDES